MRPRRPRRVRQDLHRLDACASRERRARRPHPLVDWRRALLILDHIVCGLRDVAVDLLPARGEGALLLAAAVGGADVAAKGQAFEAYTNVINTTCRGITDDEIETLSAWFSVEDTVGNGWRPNAWTFYDAYLFCFTFSSFTGIWERDLQTSVGRVLLVLVWGFPAIVIGIMASTVMARIVYLATWNYLRFWTCGIDSAHLRPRCLSACFGACMRWRDRRHYALKYLLMALGLFGLMILMCALFTALVGTAPRACAPPTRRAC